MIPVLFRRATFWYAGIWILTACAFTQLPLVGVLGYESAVAFGLVAALTTGHWVIALLHADYSWRSATRRTLALFASLSVAGMAVFMLPVAILTANAAFVRTCEPLLGALLLALIVVPSLLFLIAAAMLIVRLRSRIAAHAAMVAIALAMLLHAGLTVYVNPQLYVYNHLFGVFIGFSWDEAQPMFATLALYRVLTLLWILLMLTAATALAGAGLRRILSAAVPCVMLIITAQLLSDTLGFSTGDATLRHTLGGEYRTTHCVIHYDTTTFDAVAIRQVGIEHEQRLQEVSRALGVPIPSVRSHIYPDRTTKRKLLGTETSQIARPWSRQIHLDAATWRDALAHELVHVVAADFGPAPFRAPVLRNYGLTEGLAMAVAEDPGPRTLHEQTAALLHYGMLPSLQTLLSTGGFLAGNPSLGYVATGSFCRWFIDAHGMAAMRVMYQDDVAASSGLDTEVLDAQWRRHLSLTRRVVPDSLATLYTFRAPALIRKICPRTLTELHRKARASMFRDDMMGAARYYEESDRLSPNPRAALGLADAMLRMGAYDSVMAMGRRLLSDVTRAYSVLPIVLWMGDAAQSHGNHLLADSCYRILLRERLPGWPTDSARVRVERLRLPESNREGI